ncbi:tetratricopeptide repeat protein [Candidatus Uabimicrobium sp. HlEnr_7]|uniref:tetratricopeptide repeat protein n=1 Tax=Candidatus Uabimicrobium helgolandensis TaxID=3095367 RepID=UPI0035590B0A
MKRIKIIYMGLAITMIITVSCCSSNEANLYSCENSKIHFAPPKNSYLDPMVGVYLEPGIESAVQVPDYHVSTLIGMDDLTRKRDLEEAAHDENYRAMTLLANLYIPPEKITEPKVLSEKNVKKGLCWLRKASFRDDYVALCQLAYFYNNGLFVEQDHNKAFYLYKKAASLLPDHSRQVSIAKINLAVMHFYGQGVSKNYSKSLQLLQSSDKNPLVIKMIRYITENDFSLKSSCKFDD